MAKVWWKSCVWKCVFILVAVAAFFIAASVSVKTAEAAAKGFTTVNGKTFYIDEDGTKHKGWLLLNGKRYYFNKTTGVQLKGWGKDSQGRKMRYFTKGQGYMVTGFLTDSAGHTRYFDKNTGILARGWMTDSKGYKYYFTSGEGVMATGWLTNSKGQIRYFSKANGRMLVGFQQASNGNIRYFNESTGIMETGLKKIDGYIYYFAKSNGVMYQKGFGTVGSNKYYFDPDTGRAQIGWLTLDGKKYYFSNTGVMYVSTSATIDGQLYVFDENGVATESTYEIVGNNVKVYDQKNGKTYTLVKEFLEHPGVANGETSDLELLAALCETEAGNQGKAGMVAVALCTLNRTIRADKAFPSELRYVLYQGGSFAQYSCVTSGTLLKRLNGQYYDRAAAMEAAQEAMKIFRNHVLNGTARTIDGIPRKDFDFMYFMTDEAFWSMNLTFNKVDWIQYKDHVFFVDWV